MLKETPHLEIFIPGLSKFPFISAAIFTIGPSSPLKFSLDPDPKIE